MRRMSLVLAILLVRALPGAAADPLFPGKTGAELRGLLRLHYTPDAWLGYDAARAVLFGVVDRNDGKVELAYSTEAFPVPSVLHPIPPNDVVNTEHTWPQSKFGHVGGPGMKSDLFHLFPSRSKANGIRGNKPFADIPDDDTKQWINGPEPQAAKPAAADIHKFSESTATHFEPEEDHKGNVARALAYFYTVYETRPTLNKTWFRPQVPTLRAWHVTDPADDREADRGRRIKVYQGNENPFVLDPTLLDRALDDLAAGGADPVPPGKGVPPKKGGLPDPGADPGPAGGGPGVSILALLPDPDGPDEGNESVTLGNATDADVDLAGWKLVDKAGRKFVLAGKIPAGQTRSIRLTDSALILGNSGGTVTLVDEDGDGRHSVTYTKAQVRSGAFITFRD